VPADGMAPVTYTAVCERAGAWWEITVPELPSGRGTQARRLSDVDATVKDLVALMTGTDPALTQPVAHNRRSQCYRHPPYRSAFPQVTALRPVTLTRHQVMR
jgi:hypothetical protein